MVESPPCPTEDFTDSPETPSPPDVAFDEFEDFDWSRDSPPVEPIRKRSSQPIVISPLRVAKLQRDTHRTASLDHKAVKGQLIDVTSSLPAAPPAPVVVVTEGASASGFGNVDKGLQSLYVCREYMGP